MEYDSWFQSPIFGADAQSLNTGTRICTLSGFNPLFSGLTLKEASLSEERTLGGSFNPLFSGLTLKVDQKDSTIAYSSFNPLFSGLTLKELGKGGWRLSYPGFNPLFSGLTLKADSGVRVDRALEFQSPIFGADAQSPPHRHPAATCWVSIPYFRG